MSLGPYELGRGPLGLTHPRDECGRRIVPGSRRPNGAPPEVWDNMLSRDKAATLERRGDGRLSPSSTDIVGAVA